MERQHRVATRALAVLLTVLATLVGASAASAEGGGQNQFPCTSTTLRAGALLPDLVPDQQLLEDDHVVSRDPQTGRFLLAFSAGIMNVTCERPEGVSLAMTCWASLTCHAAAILLDAK